MLGEKDETKPTERVSITHWEREDTVGRLREVGRVLVIESITRFTRNHDQVFAENPYWRPGAVRPELFDLNGSQLSEWFQRSQQQEARFRALDESEQQRLRKIYEAYRNNDTASPDYPSDESRKEQLNPYLSFLGQERLTEQFNQWQQAPLTEEAAFRKLPVPEQQRLMTSCTAFLEDNYNSPDYPLKEVTQKFIPYSSFLIREWFERKIKKNQA